MNIEVFSTAMDAFLSVFIETRANARGDLLLLTLATGTVGIAWIAARSSVEGFSYVSFLYRVIGVAIVATLVRNYESLITKFFAVSNGLAIYASPSAPGSMSFYEDPSLFIEIVFSKVDGAIRVVSQKGILQITLTVIMAVLAIISIVLSTVAVTLSIIFLRLRISFQGTILFLTLPLLLFPSTDSIPKGQFAAFLKLLVQNMTLIVTLGLISTLVGQRLDSLADELTIQQSLLLLGFGPFMLVLLYLGFKVGAEIGASTVGGLISDSHRLGRDSSALASAMSAGSAKIAMAMKTAFKVKGGG